MISAGGLSSRRRICRTIQPTARPTATPPPTRTTNSPPRAERGERPGHDRGDRDAIEHEPGPVVDEALALDDRDELPRDAEPARDRGRRERVGGRDDRAQHERAAHDRPSTNVVRDDRHADRRHATSPTASRPIGFTFARRSRSEVKNAAL